MALEYTTSAIQLDHKQTPLFGEALDRYEAITDPRLASVMDANYATTLGVVPDNEHGPRMVSLTDRELREATAPDVNIYVTALTVLKDVWESVKSTRRPTMEIAIGNESAVAAYITEARSDELLYGLWSGGNVKAPRGRERKRLAADYTAINTLHRDIYEINRQFLVRGVHGGWVNKSLTPQLTATRGLATGITIFDPKKEK